MKLRNRGRQLAILCSLVAASSLAGCSGGDDDSSVASSTPPTTSSSPAPTTPPPSSDSSASSDSGASSGSGYNGPAGMSSPAGMSGPGSTGESSSSSAGMSGMGGMGGMGLLPPAPSQTSSTSVSMGGMSPPGMTGMTGMSSPSMGTSAMMGMGSTGMGMYGNNQQQAPKDPAPSEDEDYMTKAKYAFAIGKESVAQQYFYAHLLAHEDEAATLLEQVRWSPGSRKPTTMVRFAVGVDLKAPEGVEDVRPIGRSQMAANNAAGSGGIPSGYAMSSGMGQPGGAGQSTEKTFGDLTGKFGEELLTAFETAWDNGDFGTAFKDVEPIEPAKSAPANTGYGMSSLGMTGYSMPMTSTGGPAMTGAAPGAAAPADASPRMKAVSGKHIVPGLLFVGTGNLSELNERATEQGIDFLFLFEVSVKSARGLVQNDTRLRLVSTKDGSALGATSTLNNLKVDRAMATKSDSDDVVKQIGNIFRKVEPLKLTDLPKLEPVHAQARIKSLLEKKPDNVLQTLMETRLFQSKNLLDQEEASAAYQLAIGGGGIALSNGTVEDRQIVLDPLLPEYK